jgi:hypothetical protein
MIYVDKLRTTKKNKSHKVLTKDPFLKEAKRQALADMVEYHKQLPKEKEIEPYKERQENIILP